MASLKLIFIWNSFTQIFNRRNKRKLEIPFFAFTFPVKLEICIFSATFILENCFREKLKRRDNETFKVHKISRDEWKVKWLYCLLWWFRSCLSQWHSASKPDIAPELVLLGKLNNNTCSSLVMYVLQKMNNYQKMVSCQVNFSINVNRQTSNVYRAFL